MPRTITVTGTGSISLKPDLIEVNLTLTARNREYDAAMRESASMLEALRKSLAGSGFRDEDLKTTEFRVDTEYESFHDENGNYQRVFAGYHVIHGLKLTFDFDTDRLAEVLSAISAGIADPELSVHFTVKDPNAVSEALLEDAARNARRKAEILTKASGVSLGALLSVRYAWAEPEVYSQTNFRSAEKAVVMADSARMNFTPEDVKASDSATFEWEIR